jgi:hypothetical protein
MRYIDLPSDLILSDSTRIKTAIELADLLKDNQLYAGEIWKLLCGQDIEVWLRRIGNIIMAEQVKKIRHTKGNSVEKLAKLCSILENEIDYLLVTLVKEMDYVDLFRDIHLSDRLGFICRVNKLEEDKEFIVANGVPSEEYDTINDLCFSSDGKRFAYTAKLGDKWFAVVDGVFGEMFDYVSDFIFSPDSKRFTYAAKVGGKWFAVVDGIRGEAFDYYIRSLIFTSDSKHLSYMGKIADCKWYVMVDGACVTILENTFLPEFFPDGRRFAYYTLLDGEWFVVVDGVRCKLIKETIDEFFFSPDGQRIAYKVREDYSSKNKFILITVDGIKGKDFDEIKEFCFSADSTRFAYAAKSGNKWLVESDGICGEFFDEVNNIKFSPDCKRLAYIAKLDIEYYCVVDNIRGEPYDYLEEIEFSPDSQKIVYKGARLGNNWLIVVDGVKMEVKVDVPQTESSQIPLYFFHYVFSPNSKRFAYKTNAQGKSFVVHDGIKDEPFENVFSMVFSPNSKRLLYIAELGGKCHIILDGLRVSEDFDEIDDLRFSACCNYMEYKYRLGYNIYFRRQKI